MDLAHTIMSMIDTNPARVMCRTCKSEHNFKPKKGAKEPGAAVEKKPRATRTKAADKVVSVEVEWMKQINASTKPMKPYAPTGAFSAGDKLSHPTFGEGIVQKLIYPNKMEIIFRNDLKILVHAGQRAS